MAPKLKIESRPSPELEQERAAGKRKLEGQQESPPGAYETGPKRPARTPLNFSIESIMQPSQQQQQPGQIHDNNHLSHLELSPGGKPAGDMSRSPSPGSDVDSNRSSDAESSASTLASPASDSRRAAGATEARPQQQPRHSTLNELHLNLNTLSGRADEADSYASSSSSRGSSRASSPISPGCNSANNEPLSPGGQLERPPAAEDALGLASGLERPPNGHQPAAGTSAGGPKSGSGSARAHRSGHHSANSRIKPVCTDARLAPFECHLDNLDLWHRFHPLDTEMIITKQGRRMFPPVRVTFSFNDQLLLQQQQQAAGCNQQQQHQQQQQQQQLQLNSRDRYHVLMDILPYDNKRYRYAYHKSSWQQAGKADPPSPTKLFLHPDGPFTLDQLKRQVISFEKIKLTNNNENKHGFIVLNSMHKYQPRIHLILWRGKESQNLANAPVSLLEEEAHKTFIFSETIFTAVTAYQNHSITKLKIDSNPFAKGFRDSTRMTDLELESMQDLIADGQCPFSPPRAPPPGFPHFLFAAAQQQHHQHQFNGGLHPQAFSGPGHPGPPPPPPPYQFGGQLPPGAKQPSKDATAALLRERTIMALDSFLQQQQQHHQQQQSSLEGPNQFGKPAGLDNSGLSPSGRSERLQAGSPPCSTNGNPPSHSNGVGPKAQSTPPTSSHPFNPAAHFASALLAGENAASQAPPLQYRGPAGPPTLPAFGGPLPVPTSQAGPGQLEQFIMQQQHQFAAAMAAAAASGVHQHPAYLQSLFAQAAAAQQCQAPPPVGSTTPTVQPAGQKLDSSSASPPSARQVTQAAMVASAQQHQQHLEQTSPIGLAKSANRLQLELNQFLGHPISIPISGAPGVGAPHQIHPKQLEAIMQQQQQQLQQMAVLAQQQRHHHLTAGQCLQMEPLVLQDAGAAARRTTKNK